MRPAAVTALTAAATLAAAGALAAPAPSPDAADYVKRAGNFLKNCDARADASGKRPEPNYVCLAFMAGLVEGYTYAAIANGNPKPYCLPRPASLAELADMMTTVIERGVPETLPTAAVFHFILQENFKCDDAPAPDKAGALDLPPGAFQLAQADQLLKVTPPEEVEASQPKLPIVKPAGPAGRSSEPLLRVVEPPSFVGATPSGDTARPATPTPRASPARPQTVTGEAAPVEARPGAGTPPETTGTSQESIPAAPVDRPGTAVGATAASGPDAAVGPPTATGYADTVGPANAEGPADEVGPITDRGPVAVPLDSRTRPYSAPVIQVNPLNQPRGTLAAPVAPATPARPQGPRRIGN